MITKEEAYLYHKDIAPLVKLGVGVFAVGELMRYFLGEQYRELYRWIISAGLWTAVTGAICYSLPYIENGIERRLQNHINKVKSLENRVEND